MHYPKKRILLMVGAMLALAILLVPSAVKANRALTLSPELTSTPQAAPKAVGIEPVAEGPALTGPSSLVDPIGETSASEVVNVTPSSSSARLPRSLDDLLRLSGDEQAVRDLASRVEGGSDLLQLRDDLNGKLIRLGTGLRNAEQPTPKQLGGEQTGPSSIP